MADWLGVGFSVARIMRTGPASPTTSRANFIKTQKIKSSLTQPQSLHNYPFTQININMGFLDHVQSAALQAKGKGEIALLDREMTTCKKAFGIALFDLMLTIDKAAVKAKMKTPYLLACYSNVESAALMSCYEVAKADVTKLLNKKSLKERELDFLELEGLNQPTDTAVQKAKAAGNWFANAGTETKLIASLALLDREIRIQKEAFGLKVYNLLPGDSPQLLVTMKGTTADTKNAGFIKQMAEEGTKLKDKALESSHLMSIEGDIRTCIDDAKVDIERIQLKKDKKLQDISIL